ncbi:MAG: hypothetical protein V5B35_09655 [Candidatus Accumulibacter necessarius]|jgi:restriction endonuclease S subunit
MSPFDKARYERLLEGLEATEVLLSYAQTNNDVFRVDSNYFQKNYLKGEGVIRKKGSVRLCDLGASIKSFGAYSLNNQVDYLDSGIPFIRGVNMKRGRVNFSDMLYISRKANTLLWKSEVKEGMVLLSMSGTIGDVAIATSNWPYPVNSNQDIAKIDTNGAVNPFVLYAYLLSRYGQDYLHREARGSVQQHVFLSQIEQLEVPSFSDEFAGAVQQVIEKSEQLYRLAEKEIRAAEVALLQALSLDTWTPPEALSYVRSSGEAFAAGRLDAQFFAPRVEQLLAGLGRDGLRLSDVAPARHERFEPSGSGDFEYIEIGSLGADGTAATESVATAEAPSRATQHVRGGDIITSTVRPIRRLTALIAPDQDGAVCSSGFVVLQPQSINGEVLLTYLRLPLVCELMDLHSSATMYPAISESDLLALPIPAIATSVQAQVQQAVHQSAQARQRATRLLEAAKRAVEIAIEDSESRALKYLVEIR